MLRETYRSLLKEALKHVCNGEGNVLVDNPAKTLTEQAKKNNFCIVSDSQYMQALEDVNSLSKEIWEMKEYQSWYMLLEKALRIKPVPDTVLSRIVQTMAAHCSDQFEQQKEIYVYDPIYDYIEYDQLYSEEAEQIDDSTKIDDSDPLPDTVMYEDDEILPFEEERKLPEPLEKGEQSSKRALPSSYHSLDTPKQIYKFLDEHVYGQQAAKRAAASLIWNHAPKHLKRNDVFAGPTGCGKTEIWRQASQIYPHIRIFDASSITADGWTGSFKVRNFFDNLTPDEAEKTIYVLDEADKLFEPSFSSHGNNYSFLVQNELLRLLEGEDIIFPADDKNHLPELHLRTKHMSFVLLGSFETMLSEKNASNRKSLGFGADLSHTTYDYDSIFTPDDLVTHAGVRREVAGRIHQIVQLKPMTADDYYAILQNPVISPIKALEEQYGIHLSLDDASKHQLAEKAANSHMGVRYMTARLTEMLDEKLFSDCNSHEIMLSCM